MEAPILPGIDELAKDLIADNLDEDSSVEYAYLFPSKEEIRIVYVDPTMIPVRDGDQIAPFYFSPDVRAGVPFRSAIVVVRPEEVGKLSPPNEWGDWNAAQQIRRG